MVINGTKVNPGEHKQINLNIARLPSHTVIDIPINVFRGHKRGPVLLLMAGLHGDEVNGVEIIRRMVYQNLIAPKRGTVIAIPILNIFGFLNFSRDVPDGKNVNRSFPGSLKGSLASRVAYYFMDVIFPHIDYGIDFHTGGASRTNFPQIRCLLNNKTNEELAKAFAPPFILNARLRDKSLRKSAESKGKSIIVYEAGESLRLDEMAIREGIDGALRVMHHLKLIEDSPPPQHPTVIFQSSTWRRARKSGMFRYFVKNGAKVKRNQFIATIGDPFGEEEVKVKAPATGYVIGVNNMPIVHQGDALIHIGLME